MSKPKKLTIEKKGVEYYLDNRVDHEDYGTVWKVRGHELWAWHQRTEIWRPYSNSFIAEKQELKRITPDQALAVISMIRLPLHLACDAQGPCGIMDAQCKAVVWFSDAHVPNNGYVWEGITGLEMPDENGMGKTTYWFNRNHVIRKLLQHLNEEVLF